MTSIETGRDATVLVVDRGNHASALVDGFAARAGLVVRLGPFDPTGVRGVTHGGRRDVVHYRLDPTSDAGWSSALGAAIHLTGRLDLVVDAVTSATAAEYLAVPLPQLDVVRDRVIRAMRPGGRALSFLRVTECLTAGGAAASRYLIERWSPSRRVTRSGYDFLGRHTYSHAEQVFRAPLDLCRIDLLLA